MDIPTLGAAVALAKKTVLPQTTAADQGATLVVAADGTWQKGEVVPGAVIAVSGTTLTITQEGN